MNINWMRWMRNEKARPGREVQQQSETLDAQQDERLRAALADFRSSVHAWSDAAQSRQPTAPLVPSRQSARQGGMRRMAVAWALGCALLASGVSTAVWQYHRQQMQVAAARAVEQQRVAAQLRAQQAGANEKDLLATVDSDVSQEVPTAMEPLAQLMGTDTQ